MDTASTQNNETDARLLLLSPHWSSISPLTSQGPRGSEEHGILDAEGHIRDLSSIVPDIAGETLSSEKLAEIADPE